MTSILWTYKKEPQPIRLCRAAWDPLTIAMLMSNTVAAAEANVARKRLAAPC